MRSPHRGWKDIISEPTRPCASIGQKAVESEDRTKSSYVLFVYTDHQTDFLIFFESDQSGDESFLSSATKISASYFGKRKNGEGNERREVALP